jgi:hypothetical protein
VSGDRPVPEPELAHGADPDRDEIAALRAIVEGTAQSVGSAFFQSLVRHLALAVDVGHAFVAEFDRPTMRARTLAYSSRGAIRDNIEFDLAGTACEDVIRTGLCHQPPRPRVCPIRVHSSWIGMV